MATSQPEAVSEVKCSAPWCKRQAVYMEESTHQPGEMFSVCHKHVDPKKHVEELTEEHLE